MSCKIKFDCVKFSSAKLTKLKSLQMWGTRLYTVFRFDNPPNSVEMNLWIKTKISIFMIANKFFKQDCFDMIANAQFDIDNV